MQASTSYKENFVLAGGIGLAVALGIILHMAFRSESLWGDELFSVLFSEEPTSKLWSPWMYRETNPPLYYTLLGWWSEIVGKSDDHLRSLSLLFGTISAIACGLSTFSFTRSKTAATAASLWMVLSLIHVTYSQEIRAYALAQMAAVLSLHSFVRMSSAGLQNDKTLVKWSISYVFSTSVLLYAHSTTILFPVLFACAFVVSVILGLAERRNIVAFIATSVALAAIYVWWMAITAWQIQHAVNVDWIKQPSLVSAVMLTFQGFVTGEHDLVNGPGLASSLLLSALAVFGIFHYRKTNLLVYAFVAVGVPALLFLISQFKPVMLARTVYPASGAFIICAALGLSRLQPRRLQISVLVVVTAALFTLALLHGERFTREPWRAGIETISRVDPYARVIASRPVAALAVMRYCNKPDCNFELTTVRKADEVLTSGIDLPNSHIDYQLDVGETGPVFLIGSVSSRRAIDASHFFPSRIPPVLLDDDATRGSRVKIFYSAE